MVSAEIPLINEAAMGERLLPEQMDVLWRRGWRHFGTYFFRYSHAFYEDELRLVTPLRIDLADFSFSKSQRRNLRRNSALRCAIGPLSVTPAARELFEKHRQRFT